MKLDNTPCIIYTELESLIKKRDNRKNNPEKSSTTKLRQNIHCRYSVSAIWAFDNIENKLSLYHVEDCLKNFCISLKEKELKSRQLSTVSYICRKKTAQNLLKIKICKKLQTIICKLLCVT